MSGTHALNNRRGILLLILAVALFTGMDAAAKSLLQDYPAAQVIWVRFAGQLLAVCLILRSRMRTEVKTAFPVLHLFRSATQFGATSFFFLSLTFIGLTEATAIADINPVLITLGAALFLGERLTATRVIGVALSALGALIIIRPGFGAFTPGAVLPLLCALSYAASALLTRHIGARESPWASMFYASLFGACAAGLALPWVWVPVRSADLGLILLLACLGTAAQLALIRAFSVAEAGAIAPYSYIGLLFAAFYSYVLFDSLPDLMTLVGILVIVGSGLYVWSRETPRTARTS
ncbi:MAG: DMT family transporter [Paracoccaceae bacterium]